MTKPRIFINMHYMELGGAEISLIGLLRAIDYKKYDVDLFIHSHRGELMGSIPEEVNLLPEIKKYASLEMPIQWCVKRGFIDIVIARAVYKIVKRIYLKMHPGIRDDDDYFRSCITTWFLPKINPSKEYDLAISFLTPHKIVLDKVKARKKVAWIHIDYSSLRVDPVLPLAIWGEYDKIISISKDITKTFISVFPSLADKIMEIENIISPDYVRQCADKLSVCNEMAAHGIRLLSIGRFSYQKNFDNVPDICRRILTKGLDVTWYLIGYGGEEALIREKIKEAGVENNVIILGKRTSPYPYIKECDIYVQPSRYEGKSITVREAQILYKPVAITAYATAGSQVKHGEDGVIVPMDNEDCANKLAEFIQDKPLQDRIISYLHTHDYGNENEVEKLDLLLK